MGILSWEASSKQGTYDEPHLALHFGHVLLHLQALPIGKAPNNSYHT